MFILPTDTTALKNFDTDKIIQGVHQEMVLSKPNLTPLIEVRKPAQIFTLNNTSLDANIPLFNVPLLVNDDPLHAAKSDGRMMVDVRPYVSVTRAGELKVSKEAAYKNAVLVGELCQHWQLSEDNRREMYMHSHMPHMVFTEHVGGTLARKLNVDNYAQVRSSIIIAYYYLCLYHDYKPYTAGVLLDSNIVYKFAIKVAQVCRVNQSVVIDVISQIPTMVSIQCLCSALRDHGESERFRTIDTATIYAILARQSIHGFSTENVCAALEHPAVYSALSFVAATEYGYNSSAIGNITQNYRNSTTVKSFTDYVKNLLKG